MILRGGALVGSAFGVLLSGACFEPVGPTCTLEAVAGIVVELRGESGATLPAADAVGRAVDGAETTALEPFDDRLVGAWERPGTYAVTVDKPGYERWVRSNVRVEGGECHVVPVLLEAVLSPES